MNRRDALKAIPVVAALPFVGEVKEVTTETKALIFTLEEGVELDVNEFRRQVRLALRNAGCEQLPCLLLRGLKVETIQ